MTPSEDAYELEHLLTDAALQALFMQARRNDIAEEQNGITFIYGVDANVIRAWGNPHETPARPSRIGRTFRSDDDALATAIGSGLLNFIFSALGPDRIPLMIIPPIDTELWGILDALHDLSQTHEDPGTMEEFREALEAVMAQLHETLTSSQLADLNLKLQDLLLEAVSPLLALRRINLLFTRSRIAPIEELRPKFPPALREVLLPSSDQLTQYFDISTAVSGRREGGGFTDGWTDRLSHAGNWRPTLLMEHDAWVLARIEVWNRTLIEKGLPWRVLYITADYRLFRAASRYTVPWQNQYTFAEAFLRHPHAYLSEDGVLGPAEDDNEHNDEAGAQESVGDWLALLTRPANATLDQLLASRSMTPDPPPAIREFAINMARDGKDVGSTTDDIAQQINDKWRNFAKGSLVTDPFSGNSLDGLTRDLKRPAEELIRFVDERHASLEEDRRTVLIDYIHITTRLGRKFEAAHHVKPLIRAVAPIFFEEWRDASEAIVIMSRWSDGEVNSVEYQQAVDLLDRENPTAYAFYLGHAAFFAARGRWKSAALVARRARRIGHSYRLEAGFDERARGAHGREAAYFEATCHRQLARRSEELDAARACLVEAKGILASEKAIGKYSEFVEERISLEEATIAHCAYLFKALVEEAGLQHSDRFRAVADALWPIWQTLEQRLSEVDVAAAQKLGDVVETRLRVEVQLLSLIVSLSFLPDSGDIDLKRARSVLPRFELRFPRGTEAGLSEFERAVLLAARAREQRGRVEAAIRRRFSKLIDSIRNSGDLRPYDDPFLTTLQQKALRT